jgi:hypothetical protein
MKSQGYRELSVYYADPDYVQPKTMTTLATGIQLKSLEPCNRSTVLPLMSDKKLAKYGRSFMFVTVK